MITVLIFFIFLGGCADSPRGRETPEDTPGRTDVTAAPAKLTGKIERPSDGEMLTVGEMIEIVFSAGENTGSPVSVRITIDGRDTSFSGTVPGSLYVDSSGLPTGSRQIRIIAEYDDGSTESHPLRILLRSDIVPQRFTYRIVNSYPHDIRAFTQGLVYEGGFLYESTGQYGQSTLRKVELETGQVLRSLNLDRNMFGEGLSVHDGKLYQLTWQSNVGFIYDRESLRLLGRIHYQTEGWGLTSDGTWLLKSDGSHIIYVLEPQYFTETGRLEVYDNNGMVRGLNELEFIEGKIYANVFGTDEIVMIERETGKVTGVIDLTGLLDARYHHPNLDVLNGIAYDHENDRLFVTGKNWPRLFEIEPVPY